MLFVQNGPDSPCENKLPELWKACEYTLKNKIARGVSIEKNTSIAFKVLGSDRFIGGESITHYRRAQHAIYDSLVEENEGLFLYYLPEKNFVGQDSIILVYERAVSDVAFDTPPKKTINYITYYLSIDSASF